MKNYIITLIISVITLMTSCQEYDFGYTASDIKYSVYQKNKLDCISEDLAVQTNYYGMGEVPVTRTTDVPGTAPNSLIVDALKSFYDKYPTEPVELTGIIFVTTLRLAPNSYEYYYLNALGYSNLGRQVWCDTDTEAVNLIRTIDTDKIDATYVTNGEYIYIITPDEDGAIYLVTTKQMNGYLICIEDLGQDNLDFNDCIIYGGFNMRPRVIFRMAALPLTITCDNQQVNLDGEMFGEFDIELPFNNMNTPNDWTRAKFVLGDGTEIPVILNNKNDQPAVIGTRTDYRYHTDENNMKSSEFESIPFYNN